MVWLRYTGTKTACLYTSMLVSQSVDHFSQHPMFRCELNSFQPASVQWFERGVESPRHAFTKAPKLIEQSFL